MKTGIVNICRELFGLGHTTVAEMVIALNRRQITYNERSVRATVSRLRKAANLKSSRGRPGKIAPEIERIFNKGLGVTTVAGVLMHLNSIDMSCSVKTVRTLVQALRKKHNIVRAQSNDRRSSITNDDQCSTNPT